MAALSLRRVATPLTIGVFLLMATTGILMFFKVRLGLIQLAHEWLGWVMLLAIGLHAVLNWKAFKYYFSQRSAVAVIGFFVLMTVTSMLPINDGAFGEKGSPPMRAMAALTHIPLPVLAGAISKPGEEIYSQLRQYGLENFDKDATLMQLAADNQRKAIELLVKVIN